MLFPNNLLLDKGMLLTGDHSWVGPNVVARFPLIAPLLKPYSQSVPPLEDHLMAQIHLFLVEHRSAPIFQGSELHRGLKTLVDSLVSSGMVTWAQITVKGRTNGALRKSVWIHRSGASGKEVARCRLVLSPVKFGSLSLTLSYSGPLLPDFFNI